MDSGAEFFRGCAVLIALVLIAVLVIGFLARMILPGIFSHFHIYFK